MRIISLYCLVVACSPVFACSSGAMTGPCLLDMECDRGLVCCTQQSSRTGMCSRDCREPNCDDSECESGTVCCPGHTEDERTCRPVVTGATTACGECETDEDCPGATMCCGTAAATFCANECVRESFDASLGDGGDAGPRDGGDAGGDGCEPDNIRFFVQTGDPAPGAPGGDSFETFGTTPVVGLEDTVAFTTFLANGADQALYHFDGSALVPLAIKGQSLPVDGSAAEILAIQGNPVISSSGLVGFQVIVRGADGNPSAVYSYDPSTDGPPVFLVAEGSPTAGPLGEPFIEITPFTRREQRAVFDGAFVFHSRFLSGIREPRGVWQVSPGGVPSPVITDDDGAEGFPIDTVTYAPAMPSLAVNASNVIGMTTQLGRVPSLGFDFDRGVYRFGGAAERIAFGATATGAYLQTAMDAAGAIAYIEATPTTTAIVRERDGALESVANAGEGIPIPGLAGATMARPRAFVLLGDGRIVFLADVVDGEFDGAKAIFREAIDGSVSLIAHEGQLAPDSDAGVTIGSIDSVHVNSDGAVAFLGTLGVMASPPTAVFITDGSGALRIAVRAGDEIPVRCEMRRIRRVSVLSDLIPSTEIELFGPGHGGTPRGLSPFGTIPVHFTFFADPGTQFEALALVIAP